MAEFLQAQVLLLDIHRGPPQLANHLAHTLGRLDRDLLVLLDVGGDVLARGDEPGLGSPLCDAVMLAAGAAIQASGFPVVGAVFGFGCDGELTLGEISSRVSTLAEAGALSGALGLTQSSAQRGTVEIRGGRRTVELTVAAALTVFFDPLRALHSAAPLARAVADAPSLEHANSILNDLGVRTELDYERTASNTAANP